MRYLTNWVPPFEDLFMDIGKDKRIVDFLAGVQGLGNACKLIFGDNILEHRTGRLLFYCEGSIS